MSRPVSLLLVLLAACSMHPPAPTDASPRQEAPEPPAPMVEPPAPVKPQPKPPEPKPTVKPPIKADLICPPPPEGETDQQQMIRKLDCLLERD